MNTEDSPQMKESKWVWGVIAKSLQDSKPESPTIETRMKFHPENYPLGSKPFKEADHGLGSKPDES